jgi:DNA polymerase IV
MEVELVLRKIIHIDMDAYFASVEQRDQPRYRNHPIVVGGSPEQRGVVCAASYEARQFGIHSGMASRLAQQKCPSLIFVSPRFEVYREITSQIHAIFKQYTETFEPIALDEAYLDVTEPLSDQIDRSYATQIARHIKSDIHRVTGLTASAGVSVNKFLAKMASGHHKPNGLTVILPEQAEAFVAGLPIEKFHGIGRVTAQKMRELGIDTGAALKQRTLAELVQQFGKSGSFFYSIARGEDDRQVQANRLRKSLGAETSFAKDLSDSDRMRQELASIAHTLQNRLERHRSWGRTLTLKVKFGDYQQITRGRTLDRSFQDLETIETLAIELFNTIDLSHRSVRLLGLSMSNLDATEVLGNLQLALFPSS